MKPARRAGGAIRIGLHGAFHQSGGMPDACNWIIFHAHSTRFDAEEDEHPEFYGVFVSPPERREPEALLQEVLTNRKLFLAQIVERRAMPLHRDWGMYERLKREVDRSGYGVAITKLERNVVLEE